MVKWFRRGSKVKGRHTPTIGETPECRGNGWKTGCSCTLDPADSAAAAQLFCSAPKTMMPRNGLDHAGLALKETAVSNPLPISRETISLILGAAMGPRRVRLGSLSVLRCKNCKADCGKVRLTCDEVGIRCVRNSRL